jgi:hypothetical protein
VIENNDGTRIRTVLELNNDPIDFELLNRHSAPSLSRDKDLFRLWWVWELDLL